MKYNLIIGEYCNFTNVTLEIPDEIRFFYNKGEIGDGLHKNSEHYHTVIKTKDYKKWIDTALNTFGVYSDEIGEYTILSIHSLHNDTPIPTVDREQWFKEHDIDFSKYIITNSDRNHALLNVYRIHEFISPWKIKCSCITRRDSFSRGEYYSMNTDYDELRCIISANEYSNGYSKLIEGDDAEKLWNSMIYQVVSRVNYNPLLADKDYDFDKERNEYDKLYEEFLKVQIE